MLIIISTVEEGFDQSYGHSLQSSFDVLTTVGDNHRFNPCLLNVAPVSFEFQVITVSELLKKKQLRLVSTIESKLLRSKTVAHTTTSTY